MKSDDATHIENTCKRNLRNLFQLTSLANPLKQAGQIQG